MREDDRDSPLRDMLREAERVLDHQARRMEEEDDKTEQALALGIATLGGGLALATWVHQAGASDPPFALLTSAAATLNLTSLVLLLQSYLALPVALHIAPHPSWLAEQSRDADFGTTDFLMSVLDRAPRYYQQNADTLIAAARRRLRGLRFLVLSLTAYAVSASYMLWGV